MKSPLAIEWEKWIDAPEQAPSLDASTLQCANPGYYLRNRLHRAWMAGAEAQRKVDEEKGVNHE